MNYKTYVFRDTKNLAAGTCLGHSYNNNNNTTNRSYYFIIRFYTGRNTRGS